MILVEPTTDYDLVKRILTNRSIYPNAVDDGAPSPEEYYPIGNPVVHLLISLDDKPMGIIALVPHNAIEAHVHCGILPEARGPASRIAVHMAWDWIWHHTPFRRIVGMIPAYNRAAIKLAKDTGMVQFGVDPGSFLLKGTVYDQVYLGISKPNGKE